MSQLYGLFFYLSNHTQTLPIYSLEPYFKSRSYPLIINTRCKHRFWPQISASKQTIFWPFFYYNFSVTRPSRGIFFCSPFVVIVVQSVTTEVVTLRDNSNDYFATHSGWLGYSRKKSKGSFVIREGSFWILIVSSRGQLRPLGYYWDYSFFIFEMILSSLLICKN